MLTAALAILRALLVLAPELADALRAMSAAPSADAAGHVNTHPLAPAIAAMLAPESASKSELDRLVNEQMRAAGLTPP